ncbi:nuclease A inhibitor family protein [Microcoleus sp. S36b_A3]
MTDSTITTQLSSATQGLLFLSETDAPFEVIHWPAQGELTPPKLLQLTGHPPDAPVEQRTVDDFFAIATAEETWHDEEERETVQRFQNLVSVLKQNLSQLQVYRVGSIEIDVYIVGVPQSGDWAGLSTQVVET